MTTYSKRRAHSRRWRLALLPALILGTLATLSTVVAPTAEADAVTRVAGPALSGSVSATGSNKTQPGADAATTPAADASGSRTVTQRHTEWQVSGPLTVLAIGIAVLAIGLIVGSRIAERRGRHRDRTSAS